MSLLDDIYFARNFVDKSRLMMELFSLKAVEQGIEFGIRSVMPNWSVLSELKGNKIRALKSLGITEIVANRRVIEHQRLLNALKKAGIKVYVYNLDPSIDEKYIACNEFDSFYGIYADKWDFTQELSCY